MKPSALIVSPLLMAVCVPLVPVNAQTHQHQHAGHQHAGDANVTDAASVERPKIFLDKSPRVVAYQLARLDNERLLLVERAPDDPQYVPVYQAILTRAGMSPQYRQEAAEALAKLLDSDPASVLLEVLQGLPSDSRQARLTVDQLAEMLLQLPQETLSDSRQELTALAGTASETLRGIGFAALLTAGESERAWSLATADPAATLAWLSGIRRVPSVNARNAERERLISLIVASEEPTVRRAAIGSLAAIPAGQADTFRRIAAFAADHEYRDTSVRTLLSVPESERDDEVAAELVRVLVSHAESTPAESRTSDRFIDAMQLADQLLPRLPVSASRSYRERLREVTVRVVRIRTVEEEMRYDLPYFAVEAGRPVQLVLQNDDLMPHNLVITVPGALQEVAQAGLVAGASGGWQGKQYVPESEQVLFATHMVQAHQQERITFEAPTEPGEYPYVCTFPQHWYRMYGVMVVVEDLDAWLQNPVVPADPIGSNRSFVQAWTVDDFKPDLESGLRGRSPEIGMRLFAEASCLACHKIGSEGGLMGPELGKVFERWKGDGEAVLREILDPSYRIEDKYAMHLVLTLDGQTISGIVVKEDKDSVTLLTNPESQEPTVIAQSEIEEMVKSSTSMMPKALLDRYTRDEVLELLAFLKDQDL